MAAPHSEAPKLSALEAQQIYYEAVGDYDWELYEKENRKYLLQKVAVALCGPPTRPGNLNEGNDLKLQGYERQDEVVVKIVYNKICEQAKYAQNEENIVISTLKVVCVIPSASVPFYKPTPADYWVNLHVKKEDVILCIFHVFSVRKCISNKPGVTGCRVFIDHDGRVYQNWNAYLTHNKLPKCVMVVPENGEYKGTIAKTNKAGGGPEMIALVKCSVLPSPALGLGATVLRVADKASTVANVGALLGIAGALVVPAAAPVVITTALGVGAVTGVYSIVRSSINLADRKMHEQSVGLTSAEARASWINILVSSVGISLSGATSLLSWAASSGTNVKILMNAVTVLKYTNLGTGFIGVANSLADMIINFTTLDQTPTATELFQFTTSALFFGIGAMSNQTAQEIVQDAQAMTINDIRDALPNKARKNFDKVSAETRRVKGNIEGNSDVIKALKKIDNKDEFFSKLNKMNKQMNKNKVRISLSPDGNPLINNQHKIEINELQSLSKSGRDQLLAKYGPADVSTKNVPLEFTLPTARQTVERFTHRKNNLILDQRTS